MDTIYQFLISASILHESLIAQAEMETNEKKKRALYKAATHIYKGIKKMRPS